jgi:sugar transferase (PEP-CTERM/EpsH1 system associated)
MKLLYLTCHQIWPLTSGNRLRDYHLARELAGRASVTLVETCHPGELPSRPPDDNQFDKIISWNKSAGYTPARLIRGMMGPTPLTVLNYFDGRSASQLASLLDRGEFDAVQIESVLMSKYLSVIEAASTPPTVLADWHNIDSELMRRYSENTSNWPKKLVARRTATLLERAELMLLKSCRAHTVASERERRTLLTRCPSATIHVLPNGVDTRYFSPDKIAEMRQNTIPSASNRNLLFVGSMDYHANIDAVIWFVRSAWPEIARRHPDLQFVIVGRDPAPAVRQLASDRILVTGTVEDVRPYYELALAAIVPLRVGSGTRLKILEAMAAGVPIISTSLGAEGINVTNNVHLLIVDKAGDLIAAVDSINSSHELRSRLIQAARDLVVKQYDWSVVGKDLFSIYVDLLSKSR